MSKAKILIIEDEVEIIEGIKYFLEDANYEVDIATTGLAGLMMAAKQHPQLIILDLHLPDINGFEICRTLRADNDFDQTPIVVLTGDNSSADRTRAFELGVDDYIAKPFDFRELLIRVQRKLIACHLVEPNKKNNEVLSCGNLKIDILRHQVWIDEQPMKLGSLEFKLLLFLASNEGKLVSRHEILEQVWGSATVSERLIDPHILSLRNKMGGCCTHAIESIYKGGYILKAHAESVLTESSSH